ncbi:MAG: hypothetical protein FWF43_05170 [Propionibacteriaceae bacterium]|nr:hypothetical protein [Propionibacteriaceae bacterium]
MKKIRIVAGLVASVALLAGTVSLMPSAAQAASTYPIIQSSLSEPVPDYARLGPGSNYSVMNTFVTYKSQSFSCWTTGTSVHGDNIWGRLAGTGNGFIADWWIQLKGKTLANTGLPRCGGTGKVPVGYFDSLTYTNDPKSPGERIVTVHGWATDPDKLSSKVAIVVYAQDTGRLMQLGTGQTGATRADVKKVHPTYSSTTGFNVSVTVGSGIPTTFKVYAVDLNSGIQYLLSNGTKTLAAKK